MFVCSPWYGPVFVRLSRVQLAIAVADFGHPRFMRPFWCCPAMSWVPPCAAIVPFVLNELHRILCGVLVVCGCCLLLSSSSSVVVDCGAVSRQQGSLTPKKVGSITLQANEQFRQTVRGLDQAQLASRAIPRSQSLQALSSTHGRRFSHIAANIDASLKSSGLVKAGGCAWMRPKNWLEPGSEPETVVMPRAGAGSRNKSPSHSVGRASPMSPSPTGFGSGSDSKSPTKRTPKDRVEDTIDSYRAVRICSVHAVQHVVDWWACTAVWHQGYSMIGWFPIVVAR